MTFPVPLVYYCKNGKIYNSLDTSLLLEKKGQKCFRQVVVSFLYYGVEVYPTIFMALINLEIQQKKPPEHTMDEVNNFLYYMTPNHSQVIKYFNSDMILNIKYDY